MMKEVTRDDVIEYLTRRRWLVLVASEGLELITSDSPVVVNCVDASQRPIDFLTISLSPQLLFVALTPDGELDETILASMPLAHAIALVTGPSSYLYARQPLADGVVAGSLTLNLQTAVENAFGQPPK